jgi:hypothetical protein
MTDLGKHLAEVYETSANHYDRQAAACEKKGDFARAVRFRGYAATERNKATRLRGED